MKYFIISDIHGCAPFLNDAIEKYESSFADYLIILGDILYHGARNPLPVGYDPIECTNILNKNKDRIIAIRGNCDSEVDKMVLEFSILESNILIHLGKRVFLNHGHLDLVSNPVEGDSIIQGHTHVVQATKVDGVNYLNPGSISIPKGEFENSYAILDDKFSVYNFNDELLAELKL